MSKQTYIPPSLQILQLEQQESLLTGSSGGETITVKPGWGSGQLTNGFQRDEETSWEDDAASSFEDYWEK